MRKTLLALCAAAAVALPVWAQTFTTGGTLTNTSAATAQAVDLDQSSYANQNDKFGTIVRTYQFDIHGGALADIEIGPLLQDGAVIMGGYVQVLEAVAPATATNAISVMASGDIVALGTTLQTAGLKDIVPQDFDVGNAVVVTNATSYLTIDFSGSVPTQGVVQAVLSYFLSVP